MPTSTPPPYFPQNTLSPGDEKTRRKIKFAIIGCLALILFVLAAALLGMVYVFTM